VSSARFDGIGSRSASRRFASLANRIALVTLFLVIASGFQSHHAAAQDDESSRENPIELGEPGTVGDYEVTVTDVRPNVDDLIVAENMNNVPPVRGKQYFMAAVSVTYTGTEVGDPGFDLYFSSVGQSNVGWSTSYATCGVIPNPAFDAAELLEGETAEFNICWQIASDDADTLVMYVDSFFSFDDEPAWFSLGNEDTANAATPEIDADIVTESSLEEPIALGKAGQVGDFLVEVLDAQPDATEAVLAYDTFNDPPEAGSQFYLARVRVTYVGETKGTPSFDLNVQAVGENSVEYTTSDNSCGWVPDTVGSASELFPGGEVAYNVCWQITSADEESLVMFVEPYFVTDETERAWFALTED
jgi:hypothetical protein